MRVIVLVFYVLLIIFGITFAALNATTVEVNLYITTWKMPISVLLVLVLGIGMLLGFLLMLPRYWRLMSEHRKIKNQLKGTSS